MQNQIQKIEGYHGIENIFVEVAKNAFVQCTPSSKVVFDRGEVEIAKEFAKEFPALKIIVSIGPWRSHDIAAEFNEDKTAILIDLYSVRFPSVKSEEVTSLITSAHRILAKKD
jgi:hypothetical protein